MDTETGTDVETNQDQTHKPAPTDESASMNEEHLDDEVQEDSDIIREGEEDLVAELQEKLGEATDKYMRAVAELENFRRRSERELSDTRKFSNETLIKQFLPVMDSFEQALNNDTGDDEKLAAHVDGMKLVYQQMWDVLEKSGVSRVREDGAFDPNIHQGIQRVESEEVEEESVGQVFQRGYELNGRLVRPAMISVLIPKG